MGGGLGAEVGRAKAVPLPAGAEDTEDGIGTAAIRGRRSSTAEAMGIRPRRQQGLEYGPQLVGDVKAGGGAIVRCAPPRAGRRNRGRFSQGFSHSSIIPGYSDRLLAQNPTQHYHALKVQTTAAL